MLIEHPEPRIACDKCGRTSDHATEAEAESAGWLVDSASEPHAHVCADCR